MRIPEDVNTVRIEYLEYFLEVAKTGSISHAAKKLFITQQGLSRIIQTVEQEFGIQLFDRDNNVLQLTTAGQHFAKQAAKVTTAYKHLHLTAVSFGELPQPEKGYIEIVTTPFILTMLFPLLEDFFTASPFRDMLRIREKSIPEILDPPSTNVDRAIHILGLPSYTIEQIDDSTGHFEPLVSTEIMLLVSEQSPLARKDIVDKKDICSVPLVYYNEDLLEDILRHLFKNCDKQDLRLKVSDVHMITQKVKRNEAVTITDSLSTFLYKPSKNLAAVPIKDSVTLTLGILSIPGVKSTANDIAFIDFFKKCLRALCGPYMKLYPNAIR